MELQHIQLELIHFKVCESEMLTKITDKQIAMYYQKTKITINTLSDNV